MRKNQQQPAWTQLMSTLPWWRIGAASLLIVASAALYFHVQLKQTLPFARVQVIGVQHNINTAHLNVAILNNIDGGFFSLDVESLQQAVQALPWVRSVGVRRIWPDTLQVNVNEYMPIARWNEDALVDANGEIFQAEMSGDGLDGLVQMSGPHGTQQTVIAQYHSLQAMLQQVNLQIEDIFLSDRRALEMILSNGIRVRLGRVRDELDSGLVVRRFMLAYANELVLKADHIVEVDLRYTNGLSVTWSSNAESPPVPRNTNDNKARIG